MILELSIDKTVVHITEDGNVQCTHGKVLWSYARQHSCTFRKRVSGLPSTCRQLFRETSDVLYDRTLFAFSCPEGLISYSSKSDMHLACLRRIAIDCGPAKHMTSPQKGQIRLMFSLLSSRTPKLAHLWLRLCSYRDIYEDRHLLSNFWLSNIYRLRELQSLHLDIQDNFPGPLCVTRKTHTDQHQIEKRLQCALSVLSRYVELPKHVLSKLTKRQLSDLRTRVQEGTTDCH